MSLTIPKKGNASSNYDIFAGGYLVRLLYLPAVRLDKVSSLEKQVNNFFGTKSSVELSLFKKFSLWSFQKLILFICCLLNREGFTKNIVPGISVSN